MTQKELLYVEDAIGHEQNIIRVLKWNIEDVNDESIQSFLEKQIKDHTSMEKKLKKLLEAHNG